jgi:hypothetical protein
MDRNKNQRRDARQAAAQGRRSPGPPLARAAARQGHRSPGPPLARVTARQDRRSPGSPLARTAAARKPLPFRSPRTGAQAGR